MHPSVLRLIITHVMIVSVISLPYNRPVSIPSKTFPVNFKVLNTDGSYHFGYDTGKEIKLGLSFREEKRWPDGKVKGVFAFESPPGIFRVTHYEADHNGYRASETLHYLTDEASMEFVIGPKPKSSYHHFELL